MLQLSGVGDPAVLGRAGVAVVHAAPGVGENLADHYAVRIAARVRGTGSLNERAHGPRLAIEVLKYLFARRGILGSAVAHAYGFVRVAADAARPDVQLLFAPACYENGKVGQADVEHLPGLTCGVAQLRPRSRGHVRIESNDPLRAPLIQPNFLTEPEDCEILLGGIQFVRRLFAATPMAQYIESETWPGPAAATGRELIAFARSTGSTVYHPVGSCRMGGANAPLDPALRVRGLDRLRVIDASAMPAMVSGNTYAATIMIAGKGAHMLPAGE